MRLLRRPVWICAECVHIQTRRASGLAAAALKTEPSHLPISREVADASRDETTLRNIFDSPQFWSAFSHRRNNGQSVGLFRNRYLTKPQGFQRFAQVTLQKCKKIVAKVAAASTVNEYTGMVRDLDRLSDLLCRVIDLSDFVRSTHPDPHVQRAATQAYAVMFEYMNELNTTTRLNEQLKTAFEMPEVFASWSEEERVVGRILMKDFMDSVIDLSDDTRSRFVSLSNDVVEAGTNFVNGMTPARNHLEVESSKLRGIDPRTAKRITRWGRASIPTVGGLSHMALRQIEDSDTRRELYIAQRTPSKASTDRLDKLLSCRAELATLTGYKSFAHRTLGDKMAQTPEAVDQFLRALAENNRALVRDELGDLLEIKKADARSEGFPNRIYAWDRDHYSSQLLSSMSTRIRSPDVLSNYFSLGTVMQGLSRLFHRLYGVRLVPVETEVGETWTEDVRRLDVVDDRVGHIAVVYCDLFAREGKSPNPAHFTLRCSRSITAAEVAEHSEIGSHELFSTAAEASTDGMAHAYNSGDGLLYQLPTIALICDFPEPQKQRSGSSSSRQPPTLLSYREVATLFHEMGHAIHSILGRTQLQGVSGTRCATDFAELPSVLMEHFAFDPSVLSLWARHWETDTPINYELVKERIQIDRRMQGADIEGQILLALLDQALHSDLPGKPGFDSTKTYHNVWRQWSSVPEPRETSYPGFFGHLYGYGSTYYSYLFDRAIAGKIWKDVFQRTPAGALDPKQGEKFRDEVLKWGGGRDGWKCVAGVLGEQYDWMSQGGEAAMKEVGRWGVRD